MKWESVEWLLNLMLAIVSTLWTIIMVIRVDAIIGIIGVALTFIVFCSAIFATGYALTILFSSMDES